MFEYNIIKLLGHKGGHLYLYKLILIYSFILADRRFQQFKKFEVILEI